MLRCCDWCGAYTDCEKCDDPKVAALMDGPDIPGVFDNPMDEAQGGHIHSCCDEHELFWQDATFATSLEGEDPLEVRMMLPSLALQPVQYRIALAALTDNPDDCDCVVDPTDGSTVTACVLHPEGGSPNSYAVWAAKEQSSLTEFVALLKGMKPEETMALARTLNGVRRELAVASIFDE